MKEKCKEIEPKAKGFKLKQSLLSRYLEIQDSRNSDLEIIKKKFKKFKNKLNILSSSQWLDEDSLGRTSSGGRNEDVEARERVLHDSIRETEGVIR